MNPGIPHVLTGYLQDGRFAYSHQLKPGVNRDSHGLKVAQLAGMPHSAVIVAKETLSWLNKTNNSEDAIKSAQLTTLGQNLTALKPNSGPHIEV